MTFQRKILLSLLLLLTGASNNSFCMEQNNKCTCNLNKTDFDIATSAINLSKYQDETYQNNSKNCGSVLNLAKAQFDTFCTCGKIKNEFINFIKLFTNLYKLKNIQKELILGNPETKTNGLLKVAIKIKSSEIVKHLLKNKSNINKIFYYSGSLRRTKTPLYHKLLHLTNETSLFNCALCIKDKKMHLKKTLNQESEILKTFIQSGLENLSLKNENAPYDLLDAAKNSKVIKILLTNGLNLNEKKHPLWISSDNKIKYLIKNGLKIFYSKSVSEKRLLRERPFLREKPILNIYKKNTYKFHLFINDFKKKIKLELKNKEKNSEFLNYFKNSLSKIENEFLYNKNLPEYNKIVLLNYLAILDTIKSKIRNYKTFIEYINEKYDSNISIPWKKYIPLIPFGFDVIHKFKTIAVLIYKNYIHSKDINNRTLPQQMCNYKEVWPMVLNKKHVILFNTNINSINTKNQITHTLRNLLTGNLTIENKEKYPFLKTISRRILPLNINDNKSYIYNKYHKTLMDFIVIFLELQKINLQGAKDAITKGHSILNGNKKVQQTKIHRTRKRVKLERKSNFFGSDLASEIIKYIQFNDPKAKDEDGFFGNKQYALSSQYK